MNLQQSGLGVAITGSGSAAPLTALDNEGLSKLVETSDEWIASRTGIRQRRLATPAESVTYDRDSSGSGRDRHGRIVANGHRPDHSGNVNG
jgi:hypothetical protein